MTRILLITILSKVLHDIARADSDRTKVPYPSPRIILKLTLYIGLAGKVTNYFTGSTINQVGGDLINRSTVINSAPGRYEEADDRTSSHPIWP